MGKKIHCEKKIRGSLELIGYKIQGYKLLSAVIV